MSETITYPIAGSCQCGNVNYQLTKAPLLVVACHCKECQKLTASAFSLTAIVEAEALQVTGELKSWKRSSDSGRTNAAKLCPHCGNRIYHYDPTEPDRLKLKPGTLSDTRILQPAMHIWVSEKQAWYNIPEGVEQHQKQPW